MGTKVKYNLQIAIADPEIIAELDRVPVDAVDDYVMRALKVGILALRGARGEIDAVAVKEQMTEAMGQLKLQLLGFAGDFGKQCVSSFAEFKQAHKGAQVDMSSWLETYRNTLVTSIDQQVKRATEPLLKVMDPSSTTGVVSGIGNGVVAALDNMALKIKTEVLSQFSRDSSGSAMSRLEETIRISHQAIVRQFSLDDSNSALHRLLEVVTANAEMQDKNQREFQSEVRATLSALTAKKQAEAQSTTHGFAYEEAVGAVLGAIVRSHGHILEACGNSVGTIRSCKTGDFLGVLGADCVAPGEKIVIEAKSAGGYDTQKILGECEQARKNREAQVCIFVIDTAYAPAALTTPFTRQGDTIIVKWAQEDNDAYLRAAFSLACALVVRQAKSVKASAVDWSAMEKATLEIQKRAESLADITTWTTSIQGAAAKILDRVRIAKEALESQTVTLMDQIGGLKGGA